MTRKDALAAVEAIVGPFPEAKRLKNATDRNKRFIVGFYVPLDRENPDFNRMRFCSGGMGASFEEAIEQMKRMIQATAQPSGPTEEK